MRVQVSQQHKIYHDAYVRHVNGLRGGNRKIFQEALQSTLAAKVALLADIRVPFINPGIFRRPLSQPSLLKAHLNQSRLF